MKRFWISIAGEEFQQKALDTLVKGLELVFPDKQVQAIWDNGDGKNYLIGRLKSDLENAEFHRAALLKALRKEMEEIDSVEEGNDDYSEHGAAIRDAIESVESMDGDISEAQARFDEFDLDEAMKEYKPETVAD